MEKILNEDYCLLFFYQTLGIKELNRSKLKDKIMLFYKKFECGLFHYFTIYFYKVCIK